MFRFILVRYWYSTKVGVEHFERRCCHLSYVDAEPSVNANPIAISHDACPWYTTATLPAWMLDQSVPCAWHTYESYAPVLPHRVLVSATKVSYWRVDIESMSLCDTC